MVVVPLFFTSIQVFGDVEFWTVRRYQQTTTNVPCDRVQCRMASAANKSYRTIPKAHSCCVESVGSKCKEESRLSGENPTLPRSGRAVHLRTSNSCPPIWTSSCALNPGSQRRRLHISTPHYTSVKPRTRTRTNGPLHKNPSQWYAEPLDCAARDQWSRPFQRPPPAPPKMKSYLTTHTN